MNEVQQAAKIKWFTERTGCSAADAKQWLLESKWKIEVAIRMRRTSLVKPN